MLQAVHTYVHISLLPAWLLDVSNENALKLYMYSKRVARVLNLEYELNQIKNGKLTKFSELRS